MNYSVFGSSMLAMSVNNILKLRKFDRSSADNRQLTADRDMSQASSKDVTALESMYDIN